MLIKLDHAAKRYGDFALDCTLEVREGYVTGLVGANGSGKTTTFKTLLGLIDRDGGTAEVFGKDAASLTPADRARMGVMLADAGFSGYIDLRAVADIQAALYQNFDKAAFLEKCKEYDLDTKKQLRRLSRGMRTKAQLLCALSHGADLLLLDEPTSGLDVVARDEILDLLRSYMQQEGRGILISSHISSDLEGLCDDVYMIDRGKIVLHEDTDRLLARYGLLKLDESAFEALDKSRVLRTKKESWGVSCLTDDRAYYEAVPGLVVDRAGIDTVITMMIRGEAKR